MRGKDKLGAGKAAKEGREAGHSWLHEEGPSSLVWEKPEIP